jgi:hypothetical protein
VKEEEEVEWSDEEDGVAVWEGGGLPLRRYGNQERGERLGQ